MHVMRAKVGDEVELFDGSGLVARAQVNVLRRQSVDLQILESRREERPHRQLVLGTAVPKGDRFDWLIEKVTELGVTRLVPLVTSRSVVDPRDSKLDKMRQAVIAACKQSGRNHLMDLSPVTSWNDFVKAEFSNHACFVAHPDPSAVRMVASLVSGNPAVLCAIGPEGGFTSDEVALAVQSGARLISLGPQILRIETAALALAVLATAT